MKTLTYTTALVMTMAATSVFAHHPSDGTNPNFDMVTAQLEVVESPHIDMVMDEMGAYTATGDSAMAEATQESFGGLNTSRTGLAEPDQPQTGEGPSMIPGNANTMDLLENVE